MQIQTGNIWDVIDSFEDTDLVVVPASGTFASKRMVFSPGFAHKAGIYQPLLSKNLYSAITAGQDPPQKSVLRFGCILLDKPLGGIYWGAIQTRLDCNSSPNVRIIQDSLSQLEKVNTVKRIHMPFPGAGLPLIDQAAVNLILTSHFADKDICIWNRREQ